jgi:phosphohistidine phosphatase
VRLLVLRHGKARDAPPGGDDVERPLSASGRAAAATLGPVVRQLAPELVLCSVAVRTRQTLDALDLEDVDVAYEPGLYGAEVEQILDHVREVDDDVATVLLVGHNPGVHQLVLELTAGERVPQFRPATLAVLDVDAARWWEVGPGSGTLVSLHVPDPAAE